MKFWTFLNKRWSSWLMFFRNNGLRTTRLDKLLKGPIWENPSTFKILKHPKRCWNLHGSTLIKFFDHSQRNSVGKCRLLEISEILGLFVNTLTMTSIFFVIVRIYGKQFICNYLRNKIFFVLLTSFPKSAWNFKHFKTMMSLIAYVFGKLQAAKDVV